jgi:hypothetical protein
LKSGHGQPVLVTGAQRSAHHNTRYITSAPSLQDVVDLVQSCGERAQQVEEDHDKVLMRFQAGNADLLEEEVAAMRSGVLSVDDEGVADISDALDQLVQYSQMLQSESLPIEQSQEHEY